MYGQMTAGSWIYIGTQGIVQGTFQTFAALADQRYDGTLRGKVVLTAGLGGMGGAQPLAVTMNGGTALCLDVDPSRVQRRIETRYLDEVADSVEDGLRRVRAAAAAGRRCRSAWWPTPPRSCPRCSPAARRWTSSPTRPARTTRSTATCPSACPSRRRPSCGAASPTSTSTGRGPPWSSTAGRWSASRAPARRCSTTATTCAARPGRPATPTRWSTPASSRRTSGRCSARASAVPLRGAVRRPEDIAVADAALLDAFPDDPFVQRWIPLARERVAFQGLPARICWLGYGDRAKAGALLNDLVASGRISALS
jgi:urocanate hydratase